ncbi:hypothetical protein KC207_04975 [Phycicoccus sp. BSK3Z-2]|uniref:Uncharacterized protein n=1 Tax=Phycicoccus avicenniae TaxID=2828860 RepID=A0A941HZY4_9MICO|nr:hypothetical protein [Phycicoccus avicenniae]MBR7742639.1 hypothetical protein [Phycicoccus avicenniae]
MTHSIAARYTSLARRLRERAESGQNGLEYLGMALVAGVVIAAIAGVVNNGSVTGVIQDAWNNILKGGGS